MGVKSNYKSMTQPVSPKNSKQSSKLAESLANKIKRNRVSISRGHLSMILDSIKK